LAAVLALVEVDARILGHRLDGLGAARRARDLGLQRQFQDLSDA